MDQNSIISYTKAQRYQTDLLLFLCVFVTDAMSIPLSQNIKVALSTVLCGFIVLKEIIVPTVCAVLFPLKKNSIQFINPKHDAITAMT